MTDGIVATPSSILIAQFLGIIALYYMLVYKPLVAYAPRYIGNALIGLSTAGITIFLFTSPLVYEHILSTLRLTALE
ncbi:MAG: hypothetical protein AAB372_03680 [Patescibacteria group bacterium]